jgi:hypothetical protein
MTPHVASKPRPQAVADAQAAVVDLETARPSGPAAAVVVAAGLGCFVLGLLSVLAAASGWVSHALTVSERVGELSGLTFTAAFVFFAAWAILTVSWRGANPPLLRVAAGSFALIALGLLGTFPPFFNLFG